MNRVNAGNITTNAFQTLAVAGTTATSMARYSKDRADQALINQKNQEQRDELFAQQTELNKEKLKGLKLKNKEQRLKNRERKAKLDKTKKTVDDIMRSINSPQSENISTRIVNDLDYLALRADRIEDNNVEE